MSSGDDVSVVAVGTPQSFREQIARALELEGDEVGWVQSATAAEELLINAYAPIDVLVLSPEVKEPTRSAWPSSSAGRRRARRSSWSVTTRGTDCSRRRCARASATSLTSRRARRAPRGR